MIVYKVGEEDVEPVECETPGYPHRDAAGEVMYENTHFQSESKAWKQLLAEAESGVILEARNVEHLRAKLAEAEKKLVDASLRNVRTRNNYQEWKRKTAKPA